MKRKHLNVLFVIVVSFLLISCCELLFLAGETTEAQTVPTSKNELVCTTFYDIPLSDEFQIYIQSACEQHQVDYKSVLGIIFAESGFNPNAVNGDCIGLMQVKTIHLNELQQIGITDLNNPYQNVEAGIYLFADAIEKSDNINQALMVYNNGFNGAQELISNGVFETCYTKKVLRFAAELDVKARVYEEVETVATD